MSGIVTHVGAVLATLTLFAGTTSVAQAGGHAHKSPHGGDIVEVANRHVEFKTDSTGTIAVWLLDERQMPLAPPSGASVTLMPKGGEQVILPLHVDAAAKRLVAHFEAKKFTAFQAVVSMTVAGSKRNLRFLHPQP